jgi:hypothetical protein
MDIRDSVQSVGEVLSEFLKEGPQSLNHTAQIKDQISQIISETIIDSSESTEIYSNGCKDFLDKVIKSKGIPTRGIISEDSDRPSTVSSSGNQVATIFDTLIPKIMERYAYCVENYRTQSKIYLNEQLEQFYELLSSFLIRVPVGGSKDKTIKSEITKIKRELRSLTKWNQLFYTYKAASLVSELEYLFSIPNNPIAVVWHYSALDEQGEYKKTYSHKERDSCVYAVRGNWALEKGLMSAEPNGYIDEISRPKQEVGCMCSIQWLYGLRALPGEMLTAKGKAELQRTGQAVAALLSEKAPKASQDELNRLTPTTSGESQSPRSSASAEPQVRRNGLIATFMSWLGRSRP